MNPRPIIITNTIAVLFIVEAYFGGKHVFEQGRVEDTSPLMDNEMDKLSSQNLIQKGEPIPSPIIQGLVLVAFDE